MLKINHTIPHDADADREIAWATRLMDYCEFTFKKQRTPKMSQDNKHELQLAQWIRNQAHLARLGQLPMNRLASLQTYVPEKF